MNDTPMPFEAAYARLEAILEKMNSGKASLEDSLGLYEEADQLIASCTQRLQEAEKRIQLLVKSRDGELTLDTAGNPLTQSFIPRSC